MGIDLLIRNVRLVLPTGNFPAGAAAGLAVAGGRVAALALEPDLHELAGAAARTVDGGGAHLLPGVVDPHFHLLGYAASLVGMDCRPEQVRSIAGLQRRLREAAARTPPGRWLRAWGYSDFDLIEGRHPTAAELDAAAPDHPVRLLHRTGHACVLNSAALRLAGIGMDTPEPPGGVIERDLETGAPNGVLFEMGAYLNARNVPPPLDPDDLRTAVGQADRALAALGVTAIHDATVGNGPADWDLLASLRREGILGTRVGMMVGAERAADLAERGLAYGAGDSGLWVGAAKIVLDRSAGPLHPPRPVLHALVELCAALGFPAAIHAVEADTVAEAAAALAPVADRLPPGARGRIEHCSVCPPDLLARLRRSGIAIVTQPGFLEESGDRYLAQVPAEDLLWLYRLRGMVEAGVPLALSTDCPVIPPDPGRTLRAAVTRRAASGGALAPSEALTARQALWGMTGAGGELGGPPGLGTLRPGAPADAVLLEEDPAGEGTPWRVRLTLRNGEVAWSH